jgi:hypothetical protein
MKLVSGYCWGRGKSGEPPKILALAIRIRSWKPIECYKVHQKNLRLFSMGNVKIVSPNKTLESEPNRGTTVLHP